MARKVMNLGVLGLPGNTVVLRGILDEDTLGAGDATDFHVEVTRPAADGALVPPPGLSVGAVCLGGPTIDPPGPLLAVDTGNSLAAGETKSIDFHVTNPPGGATPALFALFVFAWVPTVWAGMSPVVTTAGPWP